MSKIIENDILAGNFENKYDTKNPVARYLVNNFLFAIKELVTKVGEEINSITDVGCGEGYLASYLNEMNIASIKACDFSTQILDIAKDLNKNSGISFYQRSIYDLRKEEDGADMILCCEVLEHIENPELGIKRLRDISNKYILLSVPDEPLWRFLNMCRGKYLRDFGNTPGHINHWSSRSFIKVISGYAEVIEVRKPLPWTILLCKKN